MSELVPLLQPEELIYQRTDKAAAAELQDRSRDAHTPAPPPCNLCKECDPKLDDSQSGSMGNRLGS